MYIEFRLPNGSAAVFNYDLDQELDAWSAKYNIPYKSKIHKFTKRVTFDSDENYSFFAMTWTPRSDNPDGYLFNYRLIETMNRV